jgi:HSP20 family protein
MADAIIYDENDINEKRIKTQKEVSEMRNLMVRPSRYNLANDVDEFFSDFWRWPFVSRRDAFAPATDIEETDKEYMLTFELPGMKKDDIKVSVEDGILTVSGEKKQTKEEKNKNYVRTEIQSGNFSRSFTLPKTVDVNNISADYKNGLLTITLQKTDEARPKQIEVKIK